MSQFVLIVVNAMLLALTVFLALTTGSTISAASSVFIGVMLLFQIVVATRR